MKNKVFFKVNDYIEYTPSEESIYASPESIANGFTKRRGIVKSVGHDKSLSVDWDDKECKLRNAWWQIPDSKFKKIGELKVVLNND